jgi:hypothetical protein
MLNPIGYTILHKKLESDFRSLAATFPAKIVKVDQATIEQLQTKELATLLEDFDTLALTIGNMTTGEGMQ